MVEFRTRKTKGRSVYPISKPRVIIEPVHVRKIRAHRHKEQWHVKGHYSVTKAGGRVWIKPYDAKKREGSYNEKEKNYERKELRYSGHFNEVADKIAKEYEDKGYSKKKAEEIGTETAADIYRSKLAKDYK